MSDDIELADEDGVFIIRPGPHVEALTPEDPHAAPGSQAHENFEDVVTTMAYMMYAMERMDWRTEFLALLRDPDEFENFFGKYRKADEGQPGPNLTLIQGGADTDADKNKDT